MQVAPDFGERSGAGYGIWQLQGQRLPERREWWPDKGKLERQRGE